MKPASNKTIARIAAITTICWALRDDSQSLFLIVNRCSVLNGEKYSITCNRLTLLLLDNLSLWDIGKLNNCLICKPHFGQASSIRSLFVHNYHISKWSLEGTKLGLKTPPRKAVVASMKLVSLSKQVGKCSGNIAWESLIFIRSSTCSLTVVSNYTLIISLSSQEIGVQ